MWLFMQDKSATLRAAALLLLLLPISDARADSASFFRAPTTFAGEEGLAAVDAAVEAGQLRTSTRGLSFELGEERFVAERLRSQPKGEALLWVGEVRPVAGKQGRGPSVLTAEDPPGIAAFYRAAEGTVYGLVIAGGNSYRLWPAQDGGHTLVHEKATGEAPECGTEGSARRPAGAPSTPPTLAGPNGFGPQAMATKSDPVRQRLLVVGGAVYTQDKGGIQGLVAWAELLVTVANQFYANGAINLELELAHVHESATNWVAGDELDALKDPNDGYNDDVPGLRDAHAADMVVLLLHRYSNSNLCGLADEILGGEDTAYAYVASGGICGPETFTFAHELGHLQGAAHNYEHAGHSGPPWAYGYRVPDGPNPFRTIMSYGSEIPRIPYFSNPFQLHFGQPIGTLDAFNAYQLWLTRGEVAAYRSGDGASTFLLPLPYTLGGLWDDHDDERHYAVQVPPSYLSRTLRVELSGGRFSTGDADLYVRADTKPTTTVYDCARTGVGNNHVCEIQNPPEGTYRIMVLADVAYSGVQLEVELSSGFGFGGVVP